MIRDFTTLKINGGIFTNSTELPFFKSSNNSNNKRISLVYGKNGSGKSTISRAFKNIKGGKTQQTFTSELLDKDSNVITLTDKDKDSIFVFNEDFIEDNIRIEGDGLNTIISIGEVKEIDDEIKKIKPDYEKLCSELEKQQKILDRYLNSNDKKSPYYYLDSMMKSLKGDDNWAGRDAKINSKKTNTPIKKESYKNFIELNPKKSRDELILEFDTELKKLEESKLGTKVINERVPILRNYLDTEENIIKLLSEKIEQPTLTEREKKLFNIFNEKDGYIKLGEIKNYFSKNKYSCPFCLQEVSKDYSQELIKNIEKILNDKLEEHKIKLEKEILTEFKDINFSIYEEISIEKVNECKDKLELLNSTIQAINSLIQKKLDNIYEPINSTSFNLMKKYEDVNKSLSELEKFREEFNSKATDIKSKKDKLEKINNEIAYYDIKTDYEQFITLYKEKKEEETKLRELSSKKYEIEKDLKDLEIKRKNVHIAMEEMNNDLSYIFFSRQRLKIDYRDDKYVLLSRNNCVDPINVSVGERNAIGLCYFFSHILKDKKIDNALNENYIFVIDDPVSSFDMENRIGILSYLKYKLSKYLNGNDDSKFLLFTHDMQTFYDFKHIISEILSARYSVNERKHTNYTNVFELKEGNINETNRNLDNEYTKLLGIIFDYACSINSNYSDIIGNIMRKVLEAYGTFLYKKGISQLSTDSDVVSNIVNRSYYENLMYRLVLNTGSHMEEKVKTLNDINFFDHISDTEKQRTAKDIICFLYELDPLHIKIHLESYLRNTNNNNNIDIKNKIIQWINSH